MEDMMDSSSVSVPGREYRPPEGRRQTRSVRGGTPILLIIVSAAVSLAGCSIPAKEGMATQTVTVATSIPEATLPAYRHGSPIANQQVAMSAARLSLEQSRLRYINTPKVVFVEQLKLEDAHKRVAQPGVIVSEDRPGDTMVWLVIFEGEWQIVPPDPGHTATPAPSTHGCMYVMMNASDGGRAEVGGVACASK